MKKMNKGLQIAGISAVVLLVAGCATETVTADYVMPPKVIKDIKAIDTMAITTDVKLSGNALGNQDKTFANGALQQRVAARLCQEGYFKTTDFVWGNPDGVSKMEDTIRKKESMHGYARHTTDLIQKRANLILNLTAEINAQTVKKNLSFTLKDVPYKEENAGKMPVGRPDLTRTRIQKVSRAVDVFSIVGTGNLSVKLVDKSGKTVYEKNFPNLKYSFETSDSKHASLPSNSAVIAEMIVPAIETVVADLSPHKESRKLEVNEDGAEHTVLLLKAQAFTEAIAALDEIKEKTYADYENLGLAYEIIGDYNAAKDAFNEALKLKAGTKIATDGNARIQAILAGKAELRKMEAKKTDTQFKKPEFK